MTNKPLLITGSSGFFGDILKKQLLTQGYTCVGLDLHNDDYSHPNLVTVQGDIRDPKLVKRLFNEHKFDAVFHCAAMLAHDIPDKSLLWESNVGGTRNIANASVESGTAKLIFTSTNCLWGQSFDRPVQEKDIPNPVEIYGLSKLEAETLLLDYSNNLDIIILRCPTIIDEGRLGLLAILFEFIDEGRTVWTVGTGRNRYQFVYAPDLAKACIQALSYEGSRIFNVGSDNVPDLRTVYEHVIEHAGTKSKVRSLPKNATLLAMKIAHWLHLSPLGPYQYKMIAEDFQFDTTRIKHELGWYPTLNNSEMLLRAYSYYHENRTDILQRHNESAHRRPAHMGIIRLVKWLS
ncbi:MAG TPA: NAD(P)-dependent oxidoreductase [Anaerolineales bacterium]|uniref:NAD-dependent epimerase/dehydratase domain-containing protein n=1 Tax=marine metagenome TaxID=408172 RepID=A0A382KHI1_9ZZZZ|nr:NAD(P)-dependent oxidoreductase [Anaerolineales bacterium]|tara:strand:+ start:1144 stop:2187 length:1044 start_codon:yes stop_codon:yes gene_type:complete